jgi:glycosyltransferase involved in cell wall biosynthesis
MSNISLQAQNRIWLKKFKEKYKKTPTILHIGNIANNAYNNAKLLNEAGFDCDVICYDYYHIMGCPEWEDADLSNDNYGNHFKPNWIAADIKKFKRPEWFAQGPLEYCIDYLIARRAGNIRNIEKLWNKLSILNKTKKKTTSRYLLANYLFLHAQLKLQRFSSIILSLATSKGVSSRIALICDKGRIANIIKSETLRISTSILLSIFSLSIRIISLPLRFLIKKKSIGSLRYTQRIQTLIQIYNQEFPDRNEKLTINDLSGYFQNIQSWEKLFEHYDIVIGYSTDPLWPMICSKPYFAFEHGTIRDLPYENTSQGRLLCLSYRLANGVFVTNFDCVKSAEYLAPNKFISINHPYDEDHGLKISGSENLRASLLNELDSDFLFFHPTRQDWVEGKGYADKSNDIFLRAFSNLRKEGIKVGLICCSWGNNIQESRDLLEKENCSDYVKWISPMAIIPFERMCLASDIVVDQFKLGAFGGIVFKAMAVGTPILTYLDVGKIKQQYSESPPVLNCRNTADICNKVKLLINSPLSLKKLGQESRAWMKKYHSKEQTVNAQVDQFRQFFSA